MQIKNPKFKEGQKVRNIEDGTIFTIKNINCYGFDDCEYWYNLECDGLTLARPESILEPYQEKPKSVWDLKEWDKYYVICAYGELMETTCINYKFDSKSKEIGNAFLTKEEAEFEVERRKVETEMIQLGGRRKIKLDEDNYYIAYENKTGNLAYHICIWVNIQGIIFFDSEIDAVKAVQEIGEDRIKKYIFGVEK